MGVDVVLMVHGGAESNLMFMDPGAAVVELCPPYLHCPCAMETHSPGCPDFYASYYLGGCGFAPGREGTPADAWPMPEFHGYVQELPHANCSAFCRTALHHNFTAAAVRRATRDVHTVPVRVEQLAAVVRPLLARRNATMGEPWADEPSRAGADSQGHGWCVAGVHTFRTLQCPAAGGFNLTGLHDVHVC